MNLGPDLWILRQPQKVPLFGNIGRCMTVIRLRDSSIILISPVPMSDAEAEKIRLFGKVRYLVSPNGLHHLHLGSAKERFPEAEIWGPLRTAKKRRDLNFTGLLSEEVRPPWADEVAMVRVKAAASSVGEEFLFFHPKSGTLVMTDFMFNVHQPGGWLARTMMGFNKALGRFTMTRMGKMVFKRHDEVQRALQRISDWKPENAVMAHGEPVVGQAHQKIRESFTWAM